jgi:hypothetical protein
MMMMVISSIRNKLPPAKQTTKQTKQQSDAAILEVANGVNAFYLLFAVSFVRLLLFVRSHCLILSLTTMKETQSRRFHRPIVSCFVTVDRSFRQAEPCRLK